TLEEFLSELSNFIVLEELNFLEHKKLKKLLKGFESLTALKILQMKKYEALEEFLNRLSNLVVLEELDFSKCRNLKKLLKEFESLVYLKILQM
uniref:Uncharacterized protein n=1 Tax=Physcomitrium patens TaxID=3218 RepID=A0A7I3Z8Z2_PHYPA